jgi:hypothetical protein
VLDALVILIVLGDLLLLVRHLALRPLPIHGHLIVLKDHLLRERWIRRNKVGALQLKIKGDEGNQRLLENPGNIRTKRRPRTTQKAYWKMKLLTSFSVPSLGSMGKSRDGGHE